MPTISATHFSQILDLDLGYGPRSQALTPTKIWDNYSYIGSIWGFGDVPCRIAVLSQVRLHDLGIQIDIIGALLFCQGGLGRWYRERAKLTKCGWARILNHFGGWGAGARKSKWTDLKGIAIRTLWDYSWSLKQAVLR